MKANELMGSDIEQKSKSPLRKRKYLVKDHLESTEESHKNVKRFNEKEKQIKIGAINKNTFD